MITQVKTRRQHAMSRVALKLSEDNKIICLSLALGMHKQITYLFL